MGFELILGRGGRAAFVAGVEVVLDMLGVLTSGIWCEAVDGSYGWSSKRGMLMKQLVK